MGYNSTNAIAGASTNHNRIKDTFTEYLLIDSERIRAEVFRKHEQGYWFLASEADKPSEAIDLASIGLLLPMTAVYAQTEGILR